MDSSVFSFWFSCFGFWFAHFGFWSAFLVSDSHFLVSDSQFLIRGMLYLITVFSFWFARFLVSDSWDFGFWFADFSFWFAGFSFWFFVADSRGVSDSRFVPWQENPLMTSLMESATPLGPALVARVDFGPEKNWGHWKVGVMFFYRVRPCSSIRFSKIGGKMWFDWPTWPGKWWVFKKIRQHEGQFRAKFVQ